MKKWIIYTLLVVFAATSASAQWWKLGRGEEEVGQPQQQQMRRGSLQGERPPMSKEQREKVRMHREETQKLADAARNETDPVKKEELVNKLRAKVTEGAEKMQAEFRKRLSKAERDVAKMKERLVKAEQSKQQRIEQHVQDLLAGKKPKHPGGGQHRKGPLSAE